MAEDFLLPDDVEQQNDIQFKTLEIPEWPKNGKPGKFRIGSLSGEDIIEWTEANEGPAKRNAGLRLIIKAMVDGNGKRIGSEKMLPTLQKRATAVLNRIVREILKMNEMTREQQDGLKNGSSGASPDGSPSA